MQSRRGFVLPTVILAITVMSLIAVAALTTATDHLPIAADYTGFVEKTSPDERVSVVLDDNDMTRDAVIIKSPSAA